MLALQEIIDLTDCDSHFLNSFVDGDESWCYKYDLSTKCQSYEWVNPGEPKGTKVRASKSKVKTMVVAFFDAQVLIQHEFVPEDKTVNSEMYDVILNASLLEFVVFDLTSSSLEIGFSLMTTHRCTDRYTYSNLSPRKV